MRCAWQVLHEDPFYKNVCKLHNGYHVILKNDRNVNGKRVCGHFYKIMGRPQRIVLKKHFLKHFFKVDLLSDFPTAKEGEQVF